MRYEGPRIDLDVHHAWKSFDEISDYLPARWREYADLPGTRVYPPSLFQLSANGITNRVDSYPPTGGPPASDLATMQTQLLDPYNIAVAVLTYQGGGIVGAPNIEFATALTTALNEWSIERWLSGQDDRLYGSLLVNTHIPEQGAKEIRRFGKNPRLVEALLVFNGARQPFGHPAYDPIFEACVEMGLPVSIHIAGCLTIQGLATATTAGGVPTTRFERHSLQMQPEQHYVTSFLAHGTFEKFPGLRLIVKETGIGWLPWLAWELDGLVHVLQLETGRNGRRPSELLREHVFISSQPLDEVDPPELLIEWLELVGGIDRMLCFSSDYPHHDFDDADTIANRLPPSWWDAVFFENALRALRLPGSLELSGRPDAAAALAD